MARRKNYCAITHILLKDGMPAPGLYARLVHEHFKAHNHGRDVTVRPDKGIAHSRPVKKS